jgi:hypothetical protein
MGDVCQNLSPKSKGQCPKSELIILAAEIAPCFHNAMAEQGPGNTKSARRRPKSDILTKRQAVWISVIAAIGILSICILYWNGFPVGETIGPMTVGGAFLVGIGYTIKTGIFRWRGGDRIYRNQEPFAFWFWVSVFGAAGLFVFSLGCLGLLRYFNLTR